MDKVRFGIIGIGNMGSIHAKYLSENVVVGATLAAICDTDAEKLAKATSQYKVPGFKTHHEMLASGQVDAVLIAVPHYDHMPIAMDAFAKGINVLCEKPIAVSVKAAREGIAAYQAAVKKFPDLKFGIMFNQRSNPLYQKLRDVIKDGELGEITRVTWLITNWFRSWAYYGSGGWRATWKGEGGGVLINQCPHNLDLIQWVVDGLLPNRVTAVGFVGKTHPIEVEDDISAILEYPNGAVGHFVTGTGEAPGTNRLEICGSRGKIVAEDNKLTFHRTRQDVQEVNRTTTQSFVHIETWKCELPIGGGRLLHEHPYITKNFTDCILKNTPNENLLAPGPEGVNGLEIGNAIMMAGLTRKPVSIPVDGDAYDAFIDDMAKKYGGKKTLQASKAQVDMGSSFQK